MPKKSLFRRVRSFVYRRGLSALPDTVALGLLHRAETGRWPNIRDPQTFNDFIQHRKLYARNQAWPGLVDKINVKKVVGDRLGAEWITPTLWQGERLPAEIPTGVSLPFVVKPSHSSGRIAFVGSAADWDHARELSQDWMQPYNSFNREWAYSQLTPRLMIEPDLSSDGVAPADYKFFVFGGVVVAIQVDTGRFSTHRRAFYNHRWERMPFGLKFPVDPTAHERPMSLSKMLGAASELGHGVDFLRADFYDIAPHPRFGEITFYPGSGTERFEPPEYDFIFGSLWRDALDRVGVGRRILTAPSQISPLDR